MILDCHVHICACTPPHGSMSDRLFNSLPFRFMRLRLGMRGYDESTERALEEMLVRTIDGAPSLDAAAVLAFDAVHTEAGVLDAASTHLYVTNDYVIELAARHPKMLFAASVHPYRRDAVAEIERCVKAGAVLLKWLPVTQNFDPSDERCFLFYEALAHFKLPLLSHTGGEQSLPNLRPSAADPRLLIPALERGVTVIAAHCGTRSKPGEEDYVPQFMRMARDHEHLYGDTAALNLPARWHAYPAVLKDPVVREKLVHGSDWPIIALPPIGQMRLRDSWQAMRIRNWMQRDIMIKRKLGFDDAYWHRAAVVLKLDAKRPELLTREVPEVPHPAPSSTVQAYAPRSQS